MIQRCAWAQSSPEYIAYHDEEWGRPVRDDVALFERLSLEAFQSGLSWITILRKREAFRRAFHNFDPTIVATYDESKINELLQDTSIVRHRGKIEACINNAKVLLTRHQQAGDGWLTRTLQDAAPSEASLVQQGFVRPPDSLNQLPSATAETERLAKQLKAEGMRFLGPTTLYAALQAAGFVHDHVRECHLFATHR